MILIIYAHPNKDGHCGSILRNTQAQLEARKQAYETIDLYADNFNPLLQPTEHFASGHPQVAPESNAYQEKIKAAGSTVEETIEDTALVDEPLETDESEEADEEPPPEPEKSFFSKYKFYIGGVVVIVLLIVMSKKSSKKD